MYVHVRTCAYMYVSPFVLSFLAHSLSKGNLQQLQLRESEGKAADQRSTDHLQIHLTRRSSPEAKVTGREFSSSQDR